MYNEKICQRLLRRFPRLTEAVWNHPTSRLMFKSIILRQDFKLWGQKLEPKCLTTVDVPEDVTLSVRGATRLHSKMGGQGFFKCPCQTTCLTEKCKCIRDSVKCNSHCHKNRSCQNQIKIFKETLFHSIECNLLFALKS